MIRFILFYPVYALIWMFTLLPFRMQYIFADLIFFIVYYIVRYRRDVVSKNISNSFPEMSDKEKSQIAKKFYRHLSDYFIESVALLNISKSTLEKRYRYKNPGLPNQFAQEGRSIILVTAHYANWEWAVLLPFILNFKILAIYKPLHNPYYNRLFIKLREKYGVDTIPMNQVFRKLAKFESEKILTCSYIVADQRPMAKDIQYWTTFLNQETPVLLGVEKISRKLNMPLFFMKISKIKRGYYESEFIPLFDQPVETPEYEITEKHTQLLEQIINEQPEYWLWSHKRWKHDRKEVEIWKESLKYKNQDEV